MGMMMAGNKVRQKVKDNLAKNAKKERIKKEKGLADFNKKENTKIRLENLKKKALLMEIDVVGKDTIASLEKKIEDRYIKIENEKIDEGLVEGLADFGITPDDDDTNEILKKKLKKAVNDKIAEDKKTEKDSEKKEDKKLSLFDRIRKKVAGEKPLSKMNKGELLKISEQLDIEASEEMTNETLVEMIKDTEKKISEESKNGK